MKSCLDRPESLEEEELQTYSETVIYRSVDELHHGQAQWSRVLGVNVIILSDRTETSHKRRPGKSSQ